MEVLDRLTPLHAKGIIKDIILGLKIIYIEKPEYYMINKIINRKGQDFRAELYLQTPQIKDPEDRILFTYRLVQLLKKAYIIDYQITYSTEDRNYGLWLKLKIGDEIPLEQPGLFDQPIAEKIVKASKEAKRKFKKLNEDFAKDGMSVTITHNLDKEKE